MTIDTSDERPTSLTSEELLAEATKENLVDCARLLAIHVAHSRTMPAAVPLVESLKYLVPAEPDPVGAELREEGRAYLVDAMRLILERAKRTAAGTLAAKHPLVCLKEQRQHARIAIAAPIRVANMEKTWERSAVLVDLSWGGASFRFLEPIEFEDDELSLSLPATRGRSIHVRSSLLRKWMTQKGHFVAVRFSCLSIDDGEMLEHVLITLLNSSDALGQREQPRIAQRIEIEYGDDGEMVGLLEDISTGGMSITALDPANLHQSLQVVIGSLSGSQRLVLRARVVRQELQRVGQLEMYRLGLQFEHPTDELKKRVNGLMQLIAFGKRRSPVLFSQPPASG